MILTVPFFYWLHEEPHDYYRYTSHKLADFCSCCGLRTVELVPYGGGLEVVLDIVGKHIAGYPRLSALHLALSRLALRIPSLRRLSEEKKHAFPLGYCLVAQK